MKTRFSKSLTVLATVFAATIMSACEDRVDIERKPELIENLVSKSIAKCQPIDGVSESIYQNDLSFFLGGFKSDVLDVFIENGDIICFDKDMINAEANLLDRVVRIMHYPSNGDDGDVISVSYNGRNAALNSTKLVNELLDSDFYNSPDNLGIAYGYTKTIGDKVSPILESIIDNSDFFSNNKKLTISPLKGNR